MSAAWVLPAAKLHQMKSERAKCFALGTGAAIRAKKKPGVAGLFDG
jgi:hypothetical protein